MDLASRLSPEPTHTPDVPRPARWPRWWWSRLQLSPNTHRSFAHTAPSTRGWLHLAMAVVWPVAVGLLAGAATSVAGTVGAVVFGLGMQVMFTASALTHLRRWDVWTTEVMFRLDHAGIFVAVAGSITPFALLVLDGPWRIGLLVLTWVLTAAGLTTTFWPARTPVGFGLSAFIAIGAVVMPFVPTMWDRAGPAAVWLLLAGAAVYVAGGIALALQRPRLNPRVFGYHEVWHALVVVGVGLHYVMIRDHLLPLG